MLDGAELGQAIAADPGHVESAVAGYEEAMFSRSRAAAVDPYDVLDVMLGERAPSSLLEVFDGALEGG